MRVRYTPRTFSDIEIVCTYIAHHNLVAAGRVVALIEKIVARLADFPESGQLSDELDARMVFSTRYPYRVYYRVVSGEIVILHIKHVARRPLERGEL
jgi:plasmid stabilization system protein ParE